MKIKIKIKAVTWQGRTVYRAYYLTYGGKRWARFGNFEAGSPEVLRNIIDGIDKTAELVWVDVD